MTYVPDTEQVDDFALNSGFTQWFSFSLDDRKKILFFASTDIEKLHGQARQSYNIPWNYGDVWLREACLYQCMFLIRHKGFREWIERAQYASMKSFSDGILSVTDQKTGKFFDDIARSMVDKALKRFGILPENSKEYMFGGWDE